MQRVDLVLVRMKCINRQTSCHLFVIGSVNHHSMCVCCVAATPLPVCLRPSSITSRCLQPPSTTAWEGWGAGAGLLACSKGGFCTSRQSSITCRRCIQRSVPHSKQASHGLALSCSLISKVAYGSMACCSLCKRGVCMADKTRQPRGYHFLVWQSITHRICGGLLTLSDPQWNFTC